MRDLLKGVSFVNPFLLGLLGAVAGYHFLGFAGCLLGLCVGVAAGLLWERLIVQGLGVARVLLLAAASHIAQATRAVLRGRADQPRA